MLHICKRIVILFFTGIFTLLYTSAFADLAFAATSQEDLTIGMKTLPLLANKLTGNATLAIIFDPTNPTSQQEANSIKSILDGGFEVPGDIKLTSILVPANDLSKMTGSKIAVLTAELSSYYEAINIAAANNEVLTMSTDLRCVQTNKCVLGIVSKPHVEIYYSKVAAEAARVNFGQVFTMLVKQI